MSERTSRKPKVRSSDVAIRIIAYGVPITVGILGFVLGWWKKLATGG